jgi:cell division transport system permease protein
MISRIFRPFKEGAIGLFRHWAMSLSSMMAVTVTLTLVAVFVILTVNLQEITSSVQSKVQIHIQIDNEVDAAGIESLQTQIQQVQGVIQVEFSDKDSELEKFIDSYGEEGRIFEMYRGERNPLKNAFIVEVEDGTMIEPVSQAIEQLAGIEAVNFGGINTLRLIDILNSVQQSGLYLVGFLGLLAIFLINNTIRMTIASRATEISIMRTIGATNWFIKAPFMVEGMMIGFFGALVPMGIGMYGYYRMYEALGGVLLSQIFRLRPIFPFIYHLAYLILLLGISVGLMGSFISVSRHLRGVR